MSIPPTTPAQQQDMLRFMSLLPWKGPSELVLLKGHLLIEEMLHAFIANKAKNQDSLKKARLTFAQRVHLARAFTSYELSEWVWEALLLLNSLRNDLSHQVEPSDWDKKVEAFVAHVKRNGALPAPPDLESELGSLPLALFAVHTSISSGLHFMPRLLGATLLTGAPSNQPLHRTPSAVEPPQRG